MFKRDLDELVQDTQTKKLQQQVGITKEEITLNKKLLASMMMKESPSPIKSAKFMAHVLPVVERK
jgi:hypothetical protein